MEPIRDINARRAPIWVIAAVIAVSYAAPPLFLFYIDAHHWFRPLSAATGGLFNVTFQNYAVLLPLVVGGLILVAGRLAPRDVGLVWSKLPVGILFTLSLWVLVNIFLAAKDLALHAPFAWDEAWTKPGPVRLAGDLIGQIFGNALYEEIVFRAFLTVQIAMLFRSLGAKWALVWGTLAAQVIFASIHVFIRLLDHVGMAAFLSTDLPQLFAIGVILAIMYILTKNIFICIGTHTLANYSLQLLHGSTVLYPGMEIDLFSCTGLVAVLLWRLAQQGRTRATRQE